MKPYPLERRAYDIATVCLKAWGQGMDFGRRLRIASEIGRRLAAEVDKDGGLPAGADLAAIEELLVAIEHDFEAATLPDDDTIVDLGEDVQVRTTFGHLRRARAALVAALAARELLHWEEPA